jgi:hypothetical protein
MLSLVTLPAKLLRVCAASRPGSVEPNMTARKIKTPTRITGKEFLTAQVFIAVV